MLSVLVFRSLQLFGYFAASPAVLVCRLSPNPGAIQPRHVLHVPPASPHLIGGVESCSYPCLEYRIIYPAATFPAMSQCHVIVPSNASLIKRHCAAKTKPLLSSNEQTRPSDTDTESLSLQNTEERGKRSRFSSHTGSYFLSAFETGRGRSCHKTL